MDATLPQLLARYQATNLDINRHLIELTYQSTAIDGCSLTPAETHALLHSSQSIPKKPITDQLMAIDHHDALQQIIAMATHREPLNRLVLQQLAATLMRQTGGVIPTLLSRFDTSQGDLRIDNTTAGKRSLVPAHKLPAALDDLLKQINTTITQLKTPRQLYDLSFRAHFDLLTLHPFGAGNGRLARLLMTYVQQYHRLPLNWVYAESRPAYLASLEASWREKSPRFLINFMHGQLTRLLQDVVDQPAGVQ